MQAGLARRRLTFREVFVCQPSLLVLGNGFWPPEQQLMTEAHRW